MINYSLKILASLLLLVPLLSIADTNINWKKINTHKSEEIKTGQGAWFSKQKENILISSGVASATAPFIAENLIAEISASSEIRVLSDEGYTSATLAAKDGNRSFAATNSYHNATIVVGGIHHNKASALVNLLVWQTATKAITSYALPSLPQKALSPSAVIIDDNLYVLIGSDAGNSFYTLDLKKFTNSQGEFIEISNALMPSWSKLATLPLDNATASYINGVQLVVQNDGAGKKIFALGGYSLKNSPEQIGYNILPVNLLWKFNPTENVWHAPEKIAFAKQNLNEQINTVSALGQSHILAFTSQGKTLSYNAITNSWAQYNQLNADKNLTDESFISKNILTVGKNIYSLNQSTRAVTELTLWQVIPEQLKRDFGWVNMTVLVVYLLCVVLVGLFFVFKNKNTDDYFRGGQSIPWWAAACSIYATMLSSLTYVALPAIVYQTNWLLLIGIWMIIVVAPIAVYVAIPFFRQIDATSAYEYLSKRFNMSVRLFASGLFTLFHIGRMGIVMALTALALSAVTPLSASDSVLIMGVLCLIYCTMGGIEAVIWTDTLQTIVLLVGAVTCFVTIIMGLDGGLTEFITIGFSDDKFTMVDADFSLNSITSLSIWVIVIGGIGQNISSYTADQAVVQRYMVTSNINEAKKSIWANAAMAAPGALLFFCIGTGLYAFYQVHPEKLDPTIQIDQIFPTFIATELPIGIAGLIVAGIFAAAQSTVSTSMNSIATTLVTDFIKPFNLVKTEKGYMSAARWLTFIMGALGTLAGLIFIDPEIRSLMNAYFKVIGMFMGALGGLFVLGALTKKANATGAIIGIFAGVVTMISAWQMGWANGYLYATIGITSCLVVGYVASLLFQGNEKNTPRDLTGLTLYTMKTPITKN
jgi:SSS family transporter